MSKGPIAIFDKSTIQSLSLDEAALFGQFYRCNLTPVFFVETLADLEKKVREGQTPEQVVGVIAAKTANLTADPNTSHQRLVIHNLVTGHVVMDGRPHVEGGRQVESRGKRGIVYERTAEAEALHRWQHRRFLEIERDIAKSWRETLTNNSIPKLNARDVFGEGGRPRTLEECHQLAERYVQQTGQVFDTLLDFLQVPHQYRPAIIRRWIEHGQPPMPVFAPYAAYCATVIAFFRCAVSADLISSERASNSADIAYLFYLPFCQIFTSNDNLHGKTVPLFLREDQLFIPGVELKADLKKLDAHFSMLPQEELDRGLMMFDPPDNDEFLTTRLWRGFLPGWHPGEKAAVRSSPRQDKELLEEFREAENAPESEISVSTDAADFIIMKRSMPVMMGKWRIVAQDVAERSWEAERKEAARKAEAQRPPASSDDDA